MRLIDRIAIRSAKPLAVDTLRALNTPPDVMADQHRSHVIGLARWLADTEEQGRTVGSLRASEQREYDRRVQAITELDTHTPSTITRQDAQLRLLRRK